MSGRGRGRGSGDVRMNIYSDLKKLMPDIMSTRNYELIAKFIKLLETYKSNNTTSRGYTTFKNPHSSEHTGFQNPHVIQYTNVTKLVNKLGSVWTHKLEEEYLNEYGTEIDMGKMSLPAFIRSTRGIHAVQSKKDNTKYFIAPNGPHVDEPELDESESCDEPECCDEPEPDGWDESETHTISFNTVESGSVTNESPDPE